MRLLRFARNDRNGSGNDLCHVIARERSDRSNLIMCMSLQGSETNGFPLARE
ncbi:MAG TPA: hypothetical protein ACFYEB_09530 [Candidatus Brocadiia bacterium]